MKAMQVEPVANGQQPMSSVDIVSKVLCLYQGKRPSQASSKNLFLKNAGILRSTTRAETSAEMTLQEQLVGEQESTSELVELVDELKVRTEKVERELEEFKQQQQEEYNRLSELVLHLSSPGN
jgi:uncharacterized protein YlxW (UPF0749 family)